MKRRKIFASLVAMLGVVITTVLMAFGATSNGSLTFSNTQLLRPDGNSEPEISIAGDGTMGIVGLGWLISGTSLWTGPFGFTPTFQSVIDASLQQPGKRIFGGGDADVDMGSTGTLHASTLIILVNPTFHAAQIGVSAITCPNAIPNFNKNCTAQVIDTTQSDRQWITSDGPRVFISYHDSGHSTLIHVQRSDDDGFTWRRVGDPVVGQGSATGDATFNNIQGPIVADRFTHNVYDIYAAGETGILKAKTTDFDHIFVSRSTDGGESWTAGLVFHAATPVGLDNVFPTLAVDPTNGKLYAAWSDGHTVSFSTSSDEGVTWSPAVAVNLALGANTAVFPWIAAYNGTVDLVYYGTPAASKDDPTAVWNVFLAQTTNDGASFQQSTASNTPNHVGVICTNGTGCASGTRNLLDLFKVAIDPGNGRAAVIYTDDTLTTDSAGNPLPQIVLAQQQ